MPLTTPIPEKDFKFTITCSCSKYTADFENLGIAETAAEIHVMLGQSHVITCTRRVRFTKGVFPVVVSTIRQKDAVR